MKPKNFPAPQGRSRGKRVPTSRALNGRQAEAETFRRMAEYLLGSPPPARGSSASGPLLRLHDLVQLPQEIVEQCFQLLAAEGRGLGLRLDGRKLRGFAR